MGFAVGGCTSLLGDFTVAEGGGGNPDGAVCVACGNDPCVDIQTSATNCGACGAVCNGGQICEAAKCKCPSDQAFCNGQCVKADRVHCGPTCGACQLDEVCSEGCVTAPAPEFASTPRDPTGYTDSAGAPVVFKMKPTGIIGTLYECRTGPDATFTPTKPEWKPCDGAAGAEPKHTPTADSAAPQGTYRTEYRYRSDTYRSPTIARVYYIHHSLDGVATCPRPGQANDGPHFNDDQYFTAALTFAGSYPGQFPLAETFPALGQTKADTFYLHNPWIKIPFVGATHLKTFNGTWPGAANVLSTFNYNFEDRSLRHLYVLNGPRTLLLVKRQYANPLKKDCKNSFQFGSDTSGDDTAKHGASWATYGPDGFGRGRHYLDCEALVINAHGVGLCMRPNPAGTAPEPIKIDTRFENSGGSVLPGNPAVGLTSGTGTLSGTGNATFVTLSGGNTNGLTVNYYIEVPIPGTSASSPQTHWHKITSLGPAGKVSITPNVKHIFGASPPVSFAGATWRFSYNPPTAAFVIPTAFAKLHGNSHTWATRSPFWPSPGTKCEQAGCDSGKPWMTYLPP